MLGSPRYCLKSSTHPLTAGPAGARRAAGVVLSHHDEHVPQQNYQDPDSPPRCRFVPRGAAVVSGPRRRALLDPPRGRPGGLRREWPGSPPPAPSGSSRRTSGGGIWSSRRTSGCRRLPRHRPGGFRLLRLLQGFRARVPADRPRNRGGAPGRQGWLTQLTFDDGELTEAGARAALAALAGRTCRRKRACAGADAVRRPPRRRRRDVGAGPAPGRPNSAPAR